MAFCVNCGKKLGENEVCNCADNQTEQVQAVEREAVTSVDALQEAAAPCAAATVEDAPADTGKDADAFAKKLPDTQALAESAKKVAQNVATNPIVRETVDIYRGIFSKNTVPTIEKAAHESHILWLILLLISAFLNAFSFNMVVRVGMDMGKALSDYFDMGYFSTFLVAFAYQIIVFFVFTGIMMGVMALCKQQASFGCTANMVAAAMIPLSAASLINLILGIFWVQGALFVFGLACVASLVLIYIGMQKLGDFVTQSVWSYLLFIALSTIVTALVVRWVLLPVIANELINSVDLLR